MICMKKSILFLLLVTVCSLQSISREEILEKFSHEKYCSYQDVLINGDLLKQGKGPDCASRYEAIKKALQPYENRPVKVLDLGANSGYFSLRIAQDFDAICVLVDPSELLTDVCRLNDEVRGIVHFKKEASLEDLKFLAKEEHFDVVLGLNIIHFIDSWEDVTDVMFTLGNTIIIENPPLCDRFGEMRSQIISIDEYLESKNNSEIIALTIQFPFKERTGFPDVGKMFHFVNDVMLPVQQSLKKSTIDSFDTQYACSNIKFVD